MKEFIYGQRICALSFLFYREIEPGFNPSMLVYKAQLYNLYLFSTVPQGETYFWSPKPDFLICLL